MSARDAHFINPILPDFWMPYALHNFGTLPKLTNVLKPDAKGRVIWIVNGHGPHVDVSKWLFEFNISGKEVLRTWPEVHALSSRAVSAKQ